MDLLETPRLLLRPFGSGDAALVHAVYSDPEVMRYVATGPMADIAEHRAAAAGLRRPPAAARLLVLGGDRARSSGTLIGDAGLYRTPAGEVELGYTLGAAWWGRGYATEAAGALARRPRSRSSRSQEVIALAEPANVASLHVLEKLGMRRDGERIAFGRPHAVFRVQRAASSASIPSRTR